MTGMLKLREGDEVTLKPESRFSVIEIKILDTGITVAKVSVNGRHIEMSHANDTLRINPRENMTTIKFISTRKVNGVDRVSLTFWPPENILDVPEELKKKPKATNRNSDNPGPEMLIH